MIAEPRKPSLLLHCGGEEVPRSAVLASPLPKQSGAYYPISHGEALTAVLGGLERCGFELLGEAHGITKNGARYFANLAVRHPDCTIEGAELILPLRNAHDRKLAFGIGLGERAMICDNLVFHVDGRIAVRGRRKHTRNIRRDLPGLVDGMLERAVQLTAWIEERHDRWRAAQLPDIATVDHWLAEGRRRNCWPSSLVPTIEAEYWREDGPGGHAEKHEDYRGRHLMRFCNACTEGLKAKPGDVVKRTATLSRMLDDAAKQLA